MDTEPSTASPHLRNKTNLVPPIIYPDLSKVIASEKPVDNMPFNSESTEKTSPANNAAVSPADSSHSGIRLSPGFRSKVPPKAIFEKLEK